MMMSIMRGGRVNIRVNDRVGQGDPISPILFDLAADALPILLNNAKKEGLIKGVIPDLVEGELIFYNMLMTRFSC